MNTLQQQVARHLLKIGAVKFGAFRLKLHETHPDAPLSPIYLNVRTKDNPKSGPIGGVELVMIGDVLRSMVVERKLWADGIVGVPNAGDPIAEACNVRLGSDARPQLKLAKETGEGSRHVTRVLETGGLPSGATVLVFDDLVTAADSKLEAIAALEAAGFVVKDVIVLVDREQGGGQQLAERGYNLHAAFTLTELLDFYVEAWLLDPAKREEVTQYLTAASA